MKSAIYLLPLHLVYGHLNKINRIISFGDDMSDSGNYYKLTDYTKPSRHFYYNGRFSNSLVWPEALAASLNAILVNYAYAYASPDNTTFKASGKIGVPGCIQQVETFLEEHPHEEFGGMDHMALFAFNRLILVDEKVDPVASARSTRKCLGNLLSAKNMSRVAILTQFPFEMFPVAQTFSKDKFDRYEKYYTAKEVEMAGAISDLQTEFPDTKFHPINLRDLFTQLVDGTSPLRTDGKMLMDEPCLKGYYNKDCSYSPNTYNTMLSRRLFWDPYHVTAEVHSYIARSVMNSIAETPFYN
ncbi:hypothetical protein L0F63_004908 [Massospora cicadina]|nr:hypothetical protein L0F63_004908 [Massospora cicadina]